jgi:hypothetical protein
MTWERNRTWTTAEDLSTRTIVSWSSQSCLTILNCATTEIGTNKSWFICGSDETQRSATFNGVEWMRAVELMQRCLLRACCGDIPAISSTHLAQGSLWKSSTQAVSSMLHPVPHLYGEQPNAMISENTSYDMESQPGMNSPPQSQQITRSKQASSQTC